MTFDDVRKKYRDGEYKLLDSPRCISEYTVIDENKSVKWNLEEAKNRNLKIQKEREEARRKNNETYERFKQDLFESAYAEYELNKNQFNVIYEFVMRELTEYDYMSVHFVDDFEEFLDFFFEVVNMREQG